MNPMVMMMVLPLLLITVLPKMMGDPETQREMQEMQRNMANTQNQVINSMFFGNFFVGNHLLLIPNNLYICYQIFQMPEVSEVFANLFGGGGTTSQEKTKKKSNRLQKK